LVRSLEDIEEQLLSSHKQLSTLHQAIDIETKALAELHDITVNADSLSALLLAQKEKASAFEKDMSTKIEQFEQDMFQKKALWAKERSELEDHEQQVKKMRQREEDEYAYQRNMARQKDLDQYTAQKEALDKELATRRFALEQEFAAREATIVAQEQEFTALKQKAEQFPTALDKAIQDKTQNVTERLIFKYDYEAKLAQKEVEGERKLSAQMIIALEAKVLQLEL
jgi:hypothetical protein